MSSNCPQVPSNPLLRLAVRRALSGAVLSGAVVATFGTPNAQAQAPAAATNANEPQLTEVVVTGSRIKQPALEAVSPVISVSGAEIADSGQNRIEDLLNTLPQVVGDLGSSQSNGATGTASVSLRGLGAQRTLVLINGRRLMPGDPTQNGNGTADLNQIPSQLVERVDVLTGGASAVYGADAVAGVVNFVMKENFEGVQLDAGDSFWNHNNNAGDIQALETEAGFAAPTGTRTDGQSANFAAVIGSNFADDKGNATGYLTYRHTDPVLQGTRDYAACELYGPTTTFAKRHCAGSVTSYPTLFGGLGSPSYFTTIVNNKLVPSNTTPNLGFYNFAPINYYQRPDDNYQGGLFAHYDFNDHARAYMEFQWMDDQTQAQIAQSGAFYGSGLGSSGGVPNGTWTVNCANPFLTAQEYSVFGCSPTTPSVNLTFGRRNVEGAPRQDNLTHDSFREVLGVKGDINDVWSYDSNVQNGITRFGDTYLNDASKTKMTNALQAVKLPNGQIVCLANANGTVGAPGCVPWNIFSSSPASTAAANYIEAPGLQTGETSQIIWETDVTGDLGKMGVQLPTASSGLGVAVGTDWRQEKSELYPDEELITNDLAGQGAPILPTFGAFHVWEGYTEVRLPLVDDKPFVKSLDFDAGYRYSDYNLSFGSTNTWKAGLQWAPLQDVRLRGGYNVAVRAPNIQELYLQPRVQLDGTTDPCAGPKVGGKVNGNTFAQCAASGVTAAEFGNIVGNPAGQYNGLVGGNTDLSPETADTTTFGIVITPTALPSFTATIDYYDIKIKNVISSYGANLIVDNCVSSGNAASLFCGLVHRAPATGTPADGSLWIGNQGYVQDGTFNLGELQQKGIDFDANYRLDLGLAGKLGFNLSANYTLHYDTTPVPGGASYDCAGYYGPSCGADGNVIPRIKGVTRINYGSPLPGLDVWLNWRFIGPVKTQYLSQNPLLNSSSVGGSPFNGTPGLAQLGGIGNQIPGYNYIDLGVSYQVAKQVQARLGVNNITDKMPPSIVDNYASNVLWNGNTFPTTWDFGGRYLFANVQVNF